MSGAGASRGREGVAPLAALIFDLDGVVTRTAAVHDAAWKAIFDEFLERRAARLGEPFRPFDPERDYRRYVDGKPRYEGVRDFLASRGVELPFGDPADPPERETVCGLGNRKNRAFLAHLEREGVAVFESSVAWIRAARANGLRVAVVTASRNGRAVLRAAGLEHLFDAVVDGLEAERLGLRGKPAPDALLLAAARLGVRPERAAVIEDALAGVEAARRGGFARVVGVDRGSSGAALRESGADVVVADLSELALPRGGSG